jgi:signal transduction histidine kinase
VRRTLKMFEGELQADGIDMTFVIEPSYREAQIDCVFCDPVRLTQIFINLLTNVGPCPPYTPSAGITHVM